MCKSQNAGCCIIFSRDVSFQYVHHRSFTDVSQKIKRTYDLDLQDSSTPLELAIKGLAESEKSRAGGEPRGGAIAVLLEAKADHGSLSVRLVSLAYINCQKELLWVHGQNM